MFAGLAGLVFCVFFVLLSTLCDYFTGILVSVSCNMVAIATLLDTLALATPDGCSALLRL